jgi:hypothetical protein
LLQKIQKQLDTPDRLSEYANDIIQTEIASLKQQLETQSKELQSTLKDSYEAIVTRNKDKLTYFSLDVLKNLGSQVYASIKTKDQTPVEKLTSDLPKQQPGGTT